MYQNTTLGACAELDDDALLHDFEALTLDPEAFRHPDHVRLAWVYLGRYGLVESLRRYSDGLRAFAAHHGAADRYHETITWALVILVHQRMAVGASDADWPTFCAEHPDLLRWRDGAFFDYYPPEVLDSELARRTFVLPHR